MGDRALGEDVAQATLLSAYQSLRRGTEPRHVKAWLYRIAHNAALELLERRRELLPGETEECAGADGYANHAAQGELLRAMQSLPVRQQRVYLLREVQGLRIDDIAAELGLSSNQVEQSLFAARNRLAEFLVFGARLDCDTLEGIDVGSLGREGKRALKSHLRSCASCRAGRPGVAAGRVLGALLPAQVFGIARGWVTALVGGGATPAAAKIAAAAAVGAVAVSAPVTAPKLLHVIEDFARPEVALAAAPRELAASAPALLTPWYERTQPFALVAGASEPVVGPASRPLPSGVPSAPAAADEPAVEEHAEEEEAVAESDEAVDDETSAEEEEVAEEPVAEDLPHAEEPPAEESVAEEPPAEEPYVEEPLVEEPPVEEPVVEEPVPEPLP